MDWSAVLAADVILFVINDVAISFDGLSLAPYLQTIEVYGQIKMTRSQELLVAIGQGLEIINLKVEVANIF